MIAEAERLQRVFERVGDDEGASAAELLAVMGLFVSGRAAEAAARAQLVLAASEGSLLNQLEAARWIGASSVWGPTPTSEAIRILREADGRGDLPGAGLGAARMLYLQGRIDEARDAVEQAAGVLRERGDRIMLAQADEARAGIAEIEGNIAEAVRLHRASYEAKTATGDVGFASTTAVNVALVLILAGKWDEAAEFAAIAVETSSFDDIASQAGGRIAMARVVAHRGDQQKAEALANEAVAIVEATDYLDWYADVLVQVGHVLMEDGKRGEAVAALHQARELYQRKEAPVRVEKVDRLLAAWSP
jgi:tetratricopeptide (TPR) repeat protein